MLPRQGTLGEGPVCACEETTQHPCLHSVTMARLLVLCCGPGSHSDTAPGMGAVTVVLPECRDHGTDQACSVSTHLVGTFAMVAVMSHIGRVCVPRVWPCRMSDGWLPRGPEAGGKGGPGSEGAAVRAQAPWRGLSRVAGPAAGAGSGLCSGDSRVLLSKAPAFPLKFPEP